MEGLLAGFSLLSVASGSLLVATWRRNLKIQRALAEPRLANTELLRLLANSYAAAKLLLEECPTVDYAGYHDRLKFAVAAVDEFKRSADDRGVGE